MQVRMLSDRKRDAALDDVPTSLPAGRGVGIAINAARAMWRWDEKKL